MDKNKQIQFIASAHLPSRYGEFRIFVFNDVITNKEHVAVVKGTVKRGRRIPIRIHSECLTGDALGSQRCDCQEQLIKSLKVIGQQKRGAVIYLRQEGRGIGLANKIKAYNLQDQGQDTFQANVSLGFAPDAREYTAAAEMLRFLEVNSVMLMTNNLEKVKALADLGIAVEGRIPHEIKANGHNRTYLQTKKEKFGHLLEVR